MVEFDGAYCVCAALGGILLGLATSVNYVVRGKVTGMSGIVFGIISLNKSTRPLIQVNSPKNCLSLEACL